jgi:hypothetical protein
MRADGPVFVCAGADQGVETPGIRDGGERLCRVFARGIVNVLERFQQIL